jgi:hypothetical protein
LLAFLHGANVNHQRLPAHPDHLDHPDLLDNLDNLEHLGLEETMVHLANPLHHALLPILHASNVPLDLLAHLALMDQLAHPDLMDNLVHLEMLVVLDHLDLLDLLDNLDLQETQEHLVNPEAKVMMEHVEPALLDLKDLLVHLALLVPQDLLEILVHLAMMVLLDLLARLEIQDNLVVMVLPDKLVDQVSPVQMQHTVHAPLVQLSSSADALKLAKSLILITIFFPPLKHLK